MSDFSTRQIASAERYANALFQLAKEAKVLDSVSDELNKIKQLMETDTEFASTIKNPSVSKKNKINIFDIISEKLELSKLTKNFIGVIINKNRINYLLNIAQSFENLISVHKGNRVAKITSAQTLSDEQLQEIKTNLNQKFDSDFNLNVNVDPNLIGGLKIQIGSQMIDSSIKNQLQLLKEKMKEVA